jgi:hypothetical protein
MLFFIDTPLHPLALLSAVLFAAYIYHRKVTAFRNLPTDIPWIGVRNEIFATLRANLRDWNQGYKNALEGYEKVKMAPLPSDMESCLRVHSCADCRTPLLCFFFNKCALEHCIAIARPLGLTVLFIPF